MLHANATLLDDAYQAFSHGDLDPLLAALTDDISWHDSTLGPLAGHYTGKDSVLGLFGKMTEVYGGTLRLEAVGIPRIIEYGNGKPAIDLPIAEFLVAQTVLTSQFITARCAARRMVPQGSGVIIFLTGSPARPHGPGASGIGAAFGGIENLTRTMALELSGTGVRVVCLRTAANPDTRTIQDTAATVGKMMNIAKEQVLADLDQGTWLKGSPHTEDTANGAVLLASDLARMMTGTVHNATAGLCTD